MNAVSSSANDFIEENAGWSDSDTDSDELLEYYQPISTDDGYAEEDVCDQVNSDHNSVEDSSFRSLANGYADRIENRVASLDLSDNEEGKTIEEEVTMGEMSDSRVIGASLREDESLRNSPLAPETATIVMEAMRAVTFSGMAPDWADQVPEDQWINQLRILRVPPTTIGD